MNSSPYAVRSSHVTDFLAGRSHTAYAYLGAHPAQQDGRQGWCFRVWAPHAKGVSVVGSFNHWSDTASPMRICSGGIWETFLPDLPADSAYQYAIRTPDGRLQKKSDPFGFYTQLRPDTASRLFDLSGYEWSDAPWQEYRRRRASRPTPLNIYEVHLGSWRRDGQGKFLSYRDIAKWLVPYVKEMGFTAVEFMPVTEHPLDESWGYQCTGYFAPTSRFGTPHDFMYLVDQLHQAGVMVLLDWVGAHFPKDESGLGRFDGSPCFEYADPRKAELRDWGTLAFDLGRNEVRSFLTSSALFWLREYHIDGLRVDAVSSMLYLDYGGRPYVPNANGGRENLEACDFLRQLNAAVREQFPQALMIAEESTAWPHVTGTAEQGLGFTHKWNMGWAHDSLHYLGLEPVYRKQNHRDLTFPMTFAFSERHVLPLSHDDMAKGAGSLISKAHGEDSEKFAAVRAFYLYQLTQPGAKLLMMGSEFGQFQEWNFRHSLDWHLLDYHPFLQHQAFFQAANRFYLSHSALWEQDESWDGFRWIASEERDANTVVYERIAASGEELIAVVNFAPTAHMGYRIGVPKAGAYQVLFHTDSMDHGGLGRVDLRPLLSLPVAHHGLKDSIVLDLPPLTGVILQCVPVESKRRPGSAKKKPV